MKTLTIAANKKNYDVFFVDQLETLISQLATCSNAVAVLDQAICRHYPQLLSALENHIPMMTIEATEETKTISGLETILHFLQQSNATKSTTLIAIGGGITQDLVSFAAHIYHRGIRFIFIPTTLLAMCDSCIGGKTGLNFSGFKNQIGTFHVPEQIFIWPGFTQSLSEEAIYSGYGEIFKLMLIESKACYDDLKLTLNQEGFRNSKMLQHIYTSLTIKKRFIEEDEFDEGVRRILNYGHSFGHALELATHYAIPHGIAVARGIDIINYISYQSGFLPKIIYDDIHVFVQSHFYLDRHVQIDSEQLILNARRDKKMTGAKLNMILLNDIGKLEIHPIELDERIRVLLQDYLSTQQRSLIEYEQTVG